MVPCRYTFILPLLLRLLIGAAGASAVRITSAAGSIGSEVAGTIRLPNTQLVKNFLLTPFWQAFDRIDNQLSLMPPGDYQLFARVHGPGTKTGGIQFARV